MVQIRICVVGRSSVLQDKLTESTERKDDKVLLTLEEDIALEVIHQFLTFIYSGRLKDTRKDSASADPLWVELLPQLVQLALKVGNPQHINYSILLLSVLSTVIN